MLRGAFGAHFGATSGPTPPFFARFQNEWNAIDTKRMKQAFEMFFSKPVWPTLQKISLNFVKGNLKKIFFAMIIKNYKSSWCQTFSWESTFSPTWWMSKVLYAMKTFMFLKVFPISQRDISALTYFCSSFCLFIVRFYVKAWRRCSVEAPQNDLIFMKCQCDVFKSVV